MPAVTSRLAMGRGTRRPLGVLVVGAFLLLPAVSRADDAASSCADRAEKGEILRDAGKLIEARSLFVTCAQESCPLPVRKVCLPWLREIDLRIPTVVPSARDASGRDILDVQMRLDDARVALPLTGAAIPVDPGPHTLRVERAGRAPIDTTFLAREGERARIVEIKIRDDEALASLSVPTPTSPSPRPLIPTSAFVLGGVSALALGGFAYFGLTGASDYNHLQDTCGSRCASSDVAAVRTKFLVGDISLVVSAVALATAIVVVIAAHAGPKNAH